MANLSKERRDRMLAKLEELKKNNSDDESIAALNEIENALREKKFGLVFEEHTEAVDEMLKENIPVLVTDKERRLCKDENLPWNFIIEGDNLQALYLLEKTHRGKVDCIYIDPPYNTGARDWKYNNDYVDSNDEYRHSKWLSMMKSRLLVAKRLLNPADSVLIVTIDEKEYLHLGCLLEEMFPEARMQMVSSVINSGGAAREQQFFRTDEYIFICEIGTAYPQPLPLGDEWAVKADKRTNEVSWRMSLIRGGSNASRKHSPGCFYPIFVAADGSHIVSIGNPLPKESKRESVVAPNGTIAIWPIRTDGSEGVWQMSPSSLEEAIANGYVRLGRFTATGMAISYLNRKEAEKTKSPGVKIIGRRPDGSLITDDSGYVREYIPGTQWRIVSHNARIGGTNLIKEILGDSIFSYPKSLYAVHDVIRFFVANKHNAIIVDFFAGSGTTMHAVNLLNAEDGGHRKCIMVTNNEVGETKEKEFIEENKGNTDCVLTTVDDKGKEHYEIIRDSQAFKNFSDEWGIATYVTWPRMVCSIEGHDVDGNALEGDYTSSNTIEKESNRNIKQVNYLKNFTDYKLSEKKDIVYLLSDHKITKKEITDDIGYIVSENEDVSILLDETCWEDWLDELEGLEHIKNYIIITENNKLFKTIKSEIIDRFGTYKEIVPTHIPMADGFNANVKMLRCDWTPRKPEDYLLSNALCLHVKELIELQTAEEVDGVKNVIILNKSDYKRIFEDSDIAAKVEHVWVNENLVFNSAEMKALREKKFRYIPREYFSQELKEVGEYV